MTMNADIPYATNFKRWSNYKDSLSKATMEINVSVSQKSGSRSASGSKYSTIGNILKLSILLHRYLLAYQCLLLPYSKQPEIAYQIYAH